MVRYKLYTTALLFFAGITSIFAQDTLSLDAAIREAMGKNHSIQISKYSAEIADNNANAGNAGLLPKVDLNAGTNMSVTDTRVEYSNNLPPTEQSGAVSRGNNASLNLTYTLFDGFGNVYTFRKLKAADDLAELQSRQQIETTLTQVIAAYYQLSRQSENIRINNDLVRISKNRFEKAKFNTDFGGTSLAKLNAEVDLNTDSLTVASTNLAFRQARTNLNLLLGRAIDSDTRVSKTLDLGNEILLASVMEESVKSNASLLSAEKSKKISELDLQIARAARMPRLNLSSAYAFNESKNDAGFVLLNRTTGPSAGLSLNFNLFDGNRKNTVISNARISSEISRQRFEETIRKVEAEVSNAYLAYQNNIYILQLTERNLRTAELNFSRTEELYGLGQVAGLQFRNAQLDLTRAQNRIIEARYNAKISELELMRITGKLIK